MPRKFNYDAHATCDKLFRRKVKSAITVDVTGKKRLKLAAARVGRRVRD